MELWRTKHSVSERDVMEREGSDSSKVDIGLVAKPYLDTPLRSEPSHLLVTKLQANGLKTGQLSCDSPVAVRTPVATGSCYEFTPLDAVPTDGLILPLDLALRKNGRRRTLKEKERE